MLFFLIHSKCRFSHPLRLRPRGGCCLCLALSLPRVDDNGNYRGDGGRRGGGVCASHRGMGAFPVSACVCACSQPLTGGGGMGLRGVQNGSPPATGASKRQLAQAPGRIRAPGRASGPGTIDCLARKMLRHWKRCSCSELAQGSEQRTAAHRPESLFISRPSQRLQPSRLSCVVF